MPHKPATRLLLLVIVLVALSGCSRDLQAQDIVSLERNALAGAWLVPDSRSDRVSLHLLVLSGEADNDATEGLAHYVEHLAWLNAMGNETRGAFERHSNASTSHRLTRYWVAGDAANIDRLAASLARVFQPFSLDEAFMLQERDIILREYDVRITENPDATMLDDLDRRLHGTDPLARSVIGTPKEIARFSLDAASALHARTHRPDNAALLVYGNVDARSANRAIMGAFGPPADDAVPRLPLVYETQPAARDVKEQTVSNLARPRLFYRKIVRLDAPADPATLSVETRLLTAILISRLPGGLAGPLRFDAFLAESFRLDVEVLDASHLMLSFLAIPDHGVSPRELLAAFEEAFDTIASDKIPEATFSRVRQRRVDELRDSDNPPTVVFNEAVSMLSLGQQPVDHAGLVSRLEGVAYERMNELIAALAGTGRVAATLAMPEE
jgi:predicted Zn-dependent peptidase